MESDEISPRFYPNQIVRNLEGTHKVSTLSIHDSLQKITKGVEQNSDNHNPKEIEMKDSQDLPYPYKAQPNKGK